MARVHRLPSVRRVEQEASEWIARLNADDVTAEDRARFETWKAASPLNSKVFDDLSRTYERFLAAAPRMRSAESPDTLTPPADPKARWRLSTLAVAAAAIFATLLTGLYLRWFPPTTHVQSPVGEQLTVSLPDGSLMELNSNSLARIDYSPHRRIIHLDRGEAFFRVAHEASRPFWVTAGGGWVRAVGTEFNVYLRATDLRVTVSEGTVQAGETREWPASSSQLDVRKLPTWVTLSSGQQADLEATSAHKRALSPEQLAEAVAWRTGTLSFENRPLADVVTELNRYSSNQLVLEDDTLRTLPVGGTFQAGPQGATALLHLLQQNFDVRARREGTRTYLRSSTP
jgi:transmembrane sensor